MIIKFLISLTYTAVVLVLCTACQNTDHSMPQRLQELGQKLFFVPENIYASKVKIAHYDELLQDKSDPNYHLYRFEKARHLLYSGQTREAITLFNTLLEEKKKKLTLIGLEASQEDKLDDYLALSYFRLGEQENCIHHHGAASCLLPISKAGVHHHVEGSQKAIQLYLKILEQDSQDLNSRWLLNVAYMTLGKYPQEVPKKWLIPPKAFESEYPLKTFPDIAVQAGVAVNKLSGGGITEDFNRDGFLDIMVTSWFADHQMQFFINNQNGTFSEKTEEAGLVGLTGGLNMLQADYDNDGWVDVLVLRGAWLGNLGKFPNSLLKNNGDGTFSDVTEAAGLLSFHPTQTATWNDFNRDGYLDLFIGNESASAESIHPCELYLNQQDGTFKEVAAAAGIQINQKDDFYFIKGVTSGDYDNDGWADIYVSKIDPGKPNLLFRNRGVNAAHIPQFEEVAQNAGLGENLSSFPTWFWDYDNDGLLDLFVAGYRHSPNRVITYDVAAEYLGLPHSAEKGRLYRNLGNGTFQDVAPALHLNKILYAMGANYGDLDNDGYLDLYLSTGEVHFESVIPNRMFRNDRGRVFQDVTTAGGFGHLQKGHAVSFADIDNDGDQDIHVVMGGAYEGDFYYNALFQNPYQGVNHWIGIRLEGVKSNRFGVGSRIEISLIENNQKRKIYREVGSGGSFGASPLGIAIGLGKAQRIEEIKIYWNALKSRPQILKNISLDRFISVREQ
ncbi:MAG: FG-GAP-like repeat-containing protein [Microscillaceae bacterium]|nr:FG-GAP-like repeat-containing protein [Microscillaceae bacterium]